MSLLQRIFDLRSRSVPSEWRVAACCAALGLVAASLRASPPHDDVEALAVALGTSVHGVVAPADVRWEPAGSAAGDSTWGRWVMFLAADEAKGPRDVWRARVRVSPEGHPIEIVEAHNLTSTPLGDDHALVMRGERAAFATFAYGQEQSVTLLDVAGERGERARLEEDPARLATSDGLTAWLTNVQQTGTGAGIGRFDVTLEQPAIGVGLALGESALAIDLADSASAAEPRPRAGDGFARRHVTLDYARGELLDSAPGVHAEVARHLPKKLVLWAVDTVRAVPWIGPAPIAWLEERVFALRDAAKQLAFKLHGADATDTLAEAPAVAPPPAILDSSQASKDAGHWPPANILSIWRTAEPGEGEWQAPRVPWMRKLPVADASSVPPAFLRTFVRPDEERPYSKVLLVAMDMRQLDLEMEAGTEDPKPLTGSHGPGRIPRDPKVLARVAAAFNGAFKTEHGNYGMMVHKRVLLPPQPGAATVVLLADTRVGFGTWGNTHDVTGVLGVADADIVSFRQNLTPLVDQGELNPMGRALWGYTLPGTAMETERSGLCVTNAGHMIYAWGDDVNATVLGKAMKMAGCSYGMHLDMNPHHTGFIFASITEMKGHNYRSELLSPLMEISPEKYIEYAAKDFFYVLVHDPAPPPIGETTWRADKGVQPAPTWMPGVWETRVEDGSSATQPGQHLGDTIELLDVEPQRATWRIRAGMKEPDARTGAGPTHELSEDDAHRVLLAIGVGVSPEKRPRGLATDGKLILPLRALKDAPAERAEATLAASTAGLLVAQGDGSLAILRVDELASVSSHMDLAELPLLVIDGRVVPEAPRAAPSLRAALGITTAGRVMVARGTFASDVPLGEALKRAGCTRAVALDRGMHVPSFIDRAGSPTPPRERYDETVLYGLATPMKPRAFRFEPENAVATAAPHR